MKTNYESFDMKTFFKAVRIRGLVDSKTGDYKSGNSKRGSGRDSSRERCQSFLKEKF